MLTAADEVRVRYVRVTNDTKEAWSDRFDGVPITLLSGQSQNISLEMAAHFFGYHQGVEPATMLLHIAQRNGRSTGEWVTIRADLQARRRLAEKFFEDFKIEPITYKLVEDKPTSSKAPVPAITDEELEQAIHEPTSVKDRAKTGMKEPDAEPPEAPGRGHPRQDKHGRRRE